MRRRRKSRRMMRRAVPGQSREYQGQQVKAEEGVWRGPGSQAGGGCAQSSHFHSPLLGIPVTFPGMFVRQGSRGGDGGEGYRVRRWRTAGTRHLEELNPLAVAVGEGAFQLRCQLGAVDVAAQCLQRRQGLHLWDMRLVNTVRPRQVPLQTCPQGQPRPGLITPLFQRHPVPCSSSAVFGCRGDCWDCNNLP